MSLALPQGKKGQSDKPMFSTFERKGGLSAYRASIIISNSCSSSTSTLSSNAEATIFRIITRKNNFKTKIILSSKVRMELNWWIENLNLCQGKSLIAPIAQL